MHSGGRIVSVMLLVLVCGCRPDPGEPDYSGQESFEFGGDVIRDVVPADAHIPGQERLSLGIFYEGGYSQVLPVNDVVRWFDVYDSTVEIAASYEDPFEGTQSHAFQAVRSDWFGGGVRWDISEDLSAWKTLYVSLKSSSARFEEMKIGMEGAGASKLFSIRDYGFEADGRWHQISILLSDFESAGVGLESVTSPFRFEGGPGVGDEVLQVDNLYLRK